MRTERLPEGNQENYENIDVGQELEVPSLIRTPLAPTQKKREEHEATGHAVYRDWCAACLGAKGIGQKRVVNSHEDSS